MSDARDFGMISRREWERIREEAVPPYMLQMGVGAVLGAGLSALLRGKETRPLDVVLGSLAGAALGAADRYLREQDIRYGQLGRPTLRVVLGVLLIAIALTEYVDAPARRVGLAVLGGALILSGITSTGDTVPRARWLLHRVQLEDRRARARAVSARAAEIEDRSRRTRTTPEAAGMPLEGDAILLLR